jgi:hypothetical protein
MAYARQPEVHGRVGELGVDPVREQVVDPGPSGVHSRNGAALLARRVLELLFVEVRTITAIEQGRALRDQRAGHRAEPIVEVRQLAR